MKWVTRKRIRVNRAATCWLIRRFVDTDAQFLFVEPEEVAALQRRESAVGFDAPGATYNHDAGKTSFEQLVEAYAGDDLVLRELARIIHAADVAGQDHTVAEAAGLKAISRGFPLIAADDHETVELSSFVYDALYASLRERQSAALV